MRASIEDIASEYGISLPQATILLNLTSQSLQDYRLDKDFLTGTRLMNSQKFRRALFAELQKTLQLQHVAVAQSVVFDILTDETASPRVRLDAARQIMDRADYRAPPDTGANDKPLTDMTRDELATQLHAIEAELARQATDITPETPGPTPQLIELLK